MWRSPFKVKLCKNWKKSYFPKRAFRVSLPFRLRVSFIFFFKDIERFELLWEKSCKELKQPTFLQVVCEILIIISYCRTKKYMIIIFSSWSKRIFSHFSKLTFKLTEAALQVFLGKSVQKICRKFKGEHQCWSAISITLHATLLKSHFSMHVLLQIFWLFSEHLFNSTSRGLLLNSKRFEGVLYVLYMFYSSI